VSTFALVHGACHGAWCWERLTPELEGRGHRVVAVDLPTEGRSAGNVRYAEIVAESLSGLEDDVVVVGHSLAGLTIPLVAALRPVRRLVFLCAFPATIDAYMLRRDAHLTSADFLDVEQFPTIGVCDSRPVQDDRRPEYPGRYAAGQP
jgi:pimeloyl-ACP methyl ester carboxylesterase